MDMDGDLRQSDGAGVGEDAEVDHDVGEVEPDQEPEDMRRGIKSYRSITE